MIIAIVIMATARTKKKKHAKKTFTTVTAQTLTASK